MAAHGTFWKYALAQIVRKRRRTLSAVAGIAIAITLIAAENVSVDSSARALIDQQLSDVPVDMEARTDSTRDYTNATAAISTERLVKRAEPISAYQFTAYASAGGNGSKSVVIRISGIRPQFSEVASRFGFSGQLSLAPGGIVISDVLAQKLGVAVGGKLVLRAEYGYENRTMTLNVSGIISHPDVPEMYVIVTRTPFGEERSYSLDDRPGGNAFGSQFIKNEAAFVPIEELWNVGAALSESTESQVGIDTKYNRTFNYCIWVDRMATINPYDLKSSITSLSRLKQRMVLFADLYSVSIYKDNIESVLMSMSESMDSMRGEFFLFSIPVIGLGLYLGQLGVDLGMAERRQEIALLKSRGAGMSFIVRMFLVEGLVLGLIAGLVGLLCGALLSQALIQFLVPGAAAGAAVYITTGSVALSMFLGVLLMFLATYRPAKRAAKIEIVEGLQQYSTEEATEKYNPRNSVIMVTVAVLFYLVMVYFDAQKWIEEGRSQDVLYNLLLIMKAVGTLMSPLLPVLLIFGITGLLTRASYKPYGALSRITKPITREMWPVVNRNIVRNPKRASSVCIIIALGITFGLFVTMWSGSESDYQDRVARALAGSDVCANFYTHNFTLNSSIEPYLESMPGVSRVAAAHQIGNAAVLQTTIDLVALDSKNYSKTVFWDDTLFLKGSKADVESLAGGKRIVVTQDFVSKTSVDVGSTITLRITPLGGNSGEEMTCRVVAIVKAMPGMLRLDPGIEPSEFIPPPGPTAYMDMRNLDLPTLYVERSSYFVDAKDGQSLSELKKDIGSRLGATGLVERVLSYDEVLESVRGGPQSMSIYKFLLVENAFTVLIVTVGMSLILLAAAIERQRETANYIARGGSKHQVSSLFVAEAITILALAVLVGVFAGTLTAAMFQQMSAGMSSGSALLKQRLVLTADPVYLVLVTVVSLIVASYLVARKASRVDLLKVLKTRGG